MRWRMRAARRRRLRRQPRPTSFFWRRGMRGRRRESRWGVDPSIPHSGSDSDSDFSEFIAERAEIFIPGFGKHTHQIFGGASGYRDASRLDFSPSANVRAAGMVLLEFDPLVQGDAEGPVDPTEVAAGPAIDDQVVNDDFHGLDDFDFHSAADTPGLAVLPVHAAVNIGEGVPHFPIRVDLPGEGRGGLGGDGVFKRVHRVPHSALRIFYYTGV